MIYGMGALKLMSYAKNSYGVTLMLEEATEYRNKYFERYAGLVAWYNQASREIYSGATATYTLSGRRRLFSRIAGASNEIRFTSYVNTQVQGTGGDITKVALGLLRKKFLGQEIFIISQVHDEIVLEVRDDLVEYATEQLVSTMVTAGQYFVTDIPVKVEFGKGDTWGKAK